MQEKEDIRKEFFQCDCGAHAIVLDVETEVYDDPKGGPSRYRQDFSLAFFEYGHFQRKPGLWHRIKQAWRLLRNGTMFCDMVILGPDEAKKLGDFLITNVENPGQGSPSAMIRSLIPEDFNQLKEKK